MKAHLLCGKETITVDLPESAVVIESKPAKGLVDPLGATLDALNNPVGTKPLAEIAKGRKNACVVISDITRPVPNKIILPPLLKILEESGIARDEIIILIATGMHRPNLGDELETLVGKEIMDKYRIENHYCQKKEDLRQQQQLKGPPLR